MGDAGILAGEDSHSKKLKASLYGALKDANKPKRKSPARAAVETARSRVPRRAQEIQHLRNAEPHTACIPPPFEIEPQGGLLVFFFHR